jgi:hypothetical protein
MRQVFSLLTLAIASECCKVMSVTIHAECNTYSQSHQHFVLLQLVTLTE